MSGVPGAPSDLTVGGSKATAPHVVQLPLVVGATVALLGLFASPISGASMNPARTLGPDIVAWDFTGWWVYVVGPVVGAGIALMGIALVRGLPDRAEREAAEGGALPMKE